MGRERENRWQQSLMWGSVPQSMTWTEIKSHTLSQLSHPGHPGVFSFLSRNNNLYLNELGELNKLIYVEWLKRIWHMGDALWHWLPFWQGRLKATIFSPYLIFGTQGYPTDHGQEHIRVFKLHFGCTFHAQKSLIYIQMLFSHCGLHSVWSQWICLPKRLPPPPNQQNASCLHYSDSIRGPWCITASIV